MALDLSQFRQIFFEEATERLASLESGLLEISIEAPDEEALHSIFRAAHSIKGGAGTFGFQDLVDVTHVLESLLDRVRKREMPLCKEIVDLSLEARDVLASMLAAHQGEEAADSARVRAVIAALQNRLSGETPSPATDNASSAQTAAPADEDFGFFDDAPGAPGAPAPAQVETGEGYGFFEPLPQLPKPGAVVVEEGPGYGFFAPLVAPEIAAHPETPGPAPVAAAMPAQAAGAAAKAADASIRVSVAKVDQLLNLVGELVITQAMLAQSAGSLDPVLYERLLAGLSQLERNSRDLQESVMSIRMLPISTVFSRFPRTVRDLCGKLGKKASLKLLGEGTELDRGLIERITDPLTHLVRNSLDHGIEMPDVRIAAGKSPSGTITLRAAHQGGNIVIEVADDGRGLDRARILAKAASRGMAVSEDMSDVEVWQLIFEPGFSTAEEVTDVSGRGVGMDVVKKNILALGGRVEISSIAGAGTRVTIRLPLTLAILDGMLVAVGEEVFILPLNAVVESLQPKPEMVRTVQGRGKTIQLRGEYLPIVAVHEVFNLHSKVTRPEEGILVVVESAGSRVALLVDALVGQQQVVIKSLEQNYRRVNGISGATIMGDGRVALIADVAALARRTEMAALAA